VADYGSLIPVNVVTGFLGSGKTTLLQRLLRAPDLKETAVLVNEFGEVGLDHHLLEEVAESTLLLDNGCLCCAIRGDLKESLRTLLSRRERGEVPYFKRVVIETSGLADPVPIAYTVLAEPVIQHHYRLGAVITTSDAAQGPEQLDRHGEALKQAAAADHLVITKTDIAAPEKLAALRARLAQVNPSAECHTAQTDDLDPMALLDHDPFRADGKEVERRRWTALAIATDLQPEHDHSAGVTSFVMTFDAPMDWTAFGVWLTMLLNHHGEKVLRVKGLVHVAGLTAPVLINGVQHVIHPPIHLGRWPDDDRRSRLIFIVQGLEETQIRRSLELFNAL